VLCVRPSPTGSGCWAGICVQRVSTLRSMLGVSESRLDALADERIAAVEAPARTEALRWPGLLGTTLASLSLGTVVVPVRLCRFRTAGR
jgi:hypothetical protein